jgi:hypothetical protein
LNQTTELSRVKARIKALTEKTVSNGCTEAEAMSAAEMVGRLLERYALTMDEIEIRAEQCVQLQIPLRGQRRRPIDFCVPAIARFCECKVWLTRTEAGPHYVFFGFEPDIALAGYLFTIIDRAIDGEVARFRTAQRHLHGPALRLASSSFQHGMASRVGERLASLHRERDANVAAQRSQGTALMVVKHRVVDDAFRETEIRLRSVSRRTTIHNSAAYRHGMVAGDRVNLDRPVGGQAPARLT